MGKLSETNLYDGIKKTVEWYKKNKESKDEYCKQWRIKNKYYVC